MRTKRYFENRENKRKMGLLGHKLDSNVETDLKERVCNNVGWILGRVSSPLCVCENWEGYVVKHNCVSEDNKTN